SVIAGLDPAIHQLREKLGEVETGLLRFGPVPQRGVAHVTNAGRDAVDAGDAKDEGAFLRTAKSCGPDAPTLDSGSAQPCRAGRVLQPRIRRGRFRPSHIALDGIRTSRRYDEDP